MWYVKLSLRLLEFTMSDLIKSYSAQKKPAIVDVRSGDTVLIHRKDSGRQ